MNLQSIVIKLIVAILAMVGLNTITLVNANAADNVQQDSTSQVDNQLPDIDAKKATTKKKVCVKSPGTYTTTNGITVMTNNMCIDVKILKKAGCKVEAGKIERPAPPRDPQSKCKGKKKVNFVVDYTTACPPGWFGGSLALSLKIKEMVAMYGLSKSIATGRVDTWVRGHINLKDRFKIKVSNDCVKIPEVETFDQCPDLPGDQPKGYVCIQTPPPTYDECPNIPGDQPKGYVCSPPEEHKNPIAEIYVGEHAVDYQGTMPVFGRVKAFNDSIATLGSPVVTPSDLGMISNWRTVNTERDGVTACESGWVCYQGTFRVTKTGTPGTYTYGSMVAKATDNKNGTFTTQPLQFSVYYPAYVETRNAA